MIRVRVEEASSGKPRGEFGWGRLEEVGRDSALYQVSYWPAEWLRVLWHLLQMDGGTFLLCPTDVLLARLRSLCAISETNGYEIINHRTLIQHLLILHAALLSRSLVLFLNTDLMSASSVLIHSNTPKQQQLKYRFLQLVQSCSCIIIFSPSCCLLREVHFKRTGPPVNFRLTEGNITSRSKHRWKNTTWFPFQMEAIR